MPHQVMRSDFHTLTCDGLVKKYGNRTVVRDVTLRFTSGNITGLLGPNGAGKTTIFGMLVGLTVPNAGCIRLDGEDVTRTSMYLRSRMGLAYLPQEPSVFRKLTVEQNLMVVLERRRISHTERTVLRNEALARLNIHHLAQAPAYTLSGGERRRVEIARALVLSPRFLLLDEPFSGIDPIAVEDIQAILLGLREQGIGAVVTDHNVREILRITDEAYIIHDGRIFRHGSASELANAGDVREIYLGEGFKLDRHPFKKVAATNGCAH
jgi:lipopolysaccharide export system ATP-binding protein